MVPLFAPRALPATCRRTLDMVLSLARLVALAHTLFRKACQLVCLFPLVRMEIRQLLSLLLRVRRARILMSPV
jgi:hypothetical protein